MWYHDKEPEPWSKKFKDREKNKHRKIKVRRPDQLILISPEELKQWILDKVRENPGISLGSLMSKSIVFDIDGYDISTAIANQVYRLGFEGSLIRDKRDLGKAPGNHIRYHVKDRSLTHELNDS